MFPSIFSSCQYQYIMFLIKVTDYHKDYFKQQTIISKYKLQMNSNRFRSQSSPNIYADNDNISKMRPSKFYANLDNQISSLEEEMHSNIKDKGQTIGSEKVIYRVNVNPTKNNVSARSIGENIKYENQGQTMKNGSSFFSFKNKDNNSKIMDEFIENQVKTARSMLNKEKYKIEEKKQTNESALKAQIQIAILQKQLESCEVQREALILQNQELHSLITELQANKNGEQHYTQNNNYQISEQMRLLKQQYNKKCAQFEDLSKTKTFLQKRVGIIYPLQQKVEWLRDVLQQNQKELEETKQQLMNLIDKNQILNKDNLKLNEQLNSYKSKSKLNQNNLNQFEKNTKMTKDYPKNQNKEIYYRNGSNIQISQNIVITQQIFQNIVQIKQIHEKINEICQQNRSQCQEAMVILRYQNTHLKDTVEKQNKQIHMNRQRITFLEQVTAKQNLLLQNEYVKLAKLEKQMIELARKYHQKEMTQQYFQESLDGISKRFDIEVEREKQEMEEYERQESIEEIGKIQLPEIDEKQFINNKNNKQQLDYRVLSKEYTNYDKIIKQKDYTINSLKSELKQTKESRDKIQKQLKNYTQTMNNIIKQKSKHCENQIKDSNQKMASLSRKLNEYNNKLQSYQNLLAQREGQLQNMKRNSAYPTGNSQNLLNKIDELTKQKQIMKRALSQKDTFLAKSTQQIERLSILMAGRNNQNVNQIERLMTIIQQLKIKLAQQQKQKDSNEKSKIQNYSHFNLQQFYQSFLKIFNEIQKQIVQINDIPNVSLKKFLNNIATIQKANFMRDADKVTIFLDKIKNTIQQLHKKCTTGFTLLSRVEKQKPFMTINRTRSTTVIRKTKY